MTGILRLGGTILGTTNHGNPFEYPADTPEGKVDYSDRVVDTFHQMGLDALVAIGGDGTLAIAHQFFLKGIPIVGVPKTIDNDIVGTTTCFGFDTAVAFAADAIDRLHSTAEAHKRVMVVEVMGRYAGWIALHAGVAGAPTPSSCRRSPTSSSAWRNTSGNANGSARSSASSSQPKAASPWAGRPCCWRRHAPGTSNGWAASVRRWRRH